MKSRTQSHPLSLPRSNAQRHLLCQRVDVGFPFRGPAPELGAMSLAEEPSFSEIPSHP